MKLSFFFLLVAIFGFIMMAHVNGLQKRQDFDGADEDGPPGPGKRPKPGPTADVR